METTVHTYPESLPTQSASDESLDLRSLKILAQPLSSPLPEDCKAIIAPLEHKADLLDHPTSEDGKIADPIASKDGDLEIVCPTEGTGGIANSSLGVAQPLNSIGDEPACEPAVHIGTHCFNQR